MTPFDDERLPFLLNMSVILRCLWGLGFCFRSSDQAAQAPCAKSTKAHYTI
jgi:hypothetical protein